MGMIKKNSFISGAGVYLVSNILNAVIPFILLPILTRYLSPSEYGEVAMFQTLLGALGAFIGVTFVGAANRKFYDANLDKKELADFVGACIQLTIIFSLLVFLVLFVFQDKFSEWLSLEPSYILFAVAVSFCMVIINLRLGQWQIRKEAFKYGALQISQSLFNMLLSLLLVVVLLKGAEGRIDAQIFTSLVFVVIALLLLKKDNLLNIFAWRKDYLSEVLKFGVPLMPHVAGGFLLTTVDRIVINREIGLAEAGIYMVAVQLTAAIGIIFDAINKAYVPWLFERLTADQLQEKQKIVKLTYVWFGVILAGVILSFWIGPPLIVLIAGEQYAEAGKVVGWLALGQGFQGMYLMVTNYVFYSKRTGLLSAASISSGILNLVLLILLVRVFGLEGAAIAFATSMGIRFLLTWWIAQKRHPMPWFSFIQ
ncbi:lipopolysaccharide biosynthesis protein [Psychrobacter vallis]|uniref:lipopolysaccharide biosynthesis protein n=1 Tax=Psychrobacter vallis TaxID=248451 RepID=UPI0019189DE6|nr:lipopolysaccharide biosynthesis protein [Psychrobacter vallis]